MSVTVTKGEGVTVFTVNSKEGSSWPLLCQIAQQALYHGGTLIIPLAWYGVPYWLGGVVSLLYFVIVYHVIMFMAEKFPSPCFVGINMLMNLSGASLAIAGMVLYSARSTNGHFWWSNNDDNDYYGGQVTKPPSEPQRDRLLAKCKDAKCSLNALDIVLIVLAVLQLCVTISSAVLGLKALYKNGNEGKANIQDLEQYKPLLEEVTTRARALI
uniref:Uncharacterized protein n=1 Tax=Hucho hucho TaxID=62062 RepID=A0A4W5LWA7_9TELE